MDSGDDTIEVIRPTRGRTGEPKHAAQEEFLDTHDVMWFVVSSQRTVGGFSQDLVDG